MRVIPAEFQARLASGATTLCRCWRIDRGDGASLGFTDHDEDLDLDGVTFEARAGFTSSAVESGLGLSVDNSEVAGALRSDAVSEDDIAAGLFDGAEVRQWLVDWTDTSLKLLIFQGSLGEMRRNGVAFQAELLGLSEALNRPVGRAYLSQCDAAVGDGRCGVDLSDPAFSATATVTRIESGVVVAVAGLGAFAADWFSLGRAVGVVGGNAGLEQGVRAHWTRNGEALIEFWRAPARALAVGDTFVLRAGCDKRATTCREKFQNFSNFRGFPHLPGDDAIASYPNSGEAHDGGSLFR